jgi:hypothetical protein
MVSYLPIESSFFTLISQKATCAPNNQCNNATKVEDLPFNTRGTNAFSTAEAFGSGVYSCNNINSMVQSVWYEVQGEGSCLTASLPSYDFDSTLAVYGGSGGCANLTCLGESQYYNGNQVTWPTEVGETYFLLVGGYGATGNFGLEIEVRPMQCMSLPLSFCRYSNVIRGPKSQRGDCPENDFCMDAAQVGFPFVKSASNALATGEGFESPALSCSVIDGFSKTLWYEVVGDGSCLSASVAADNFEAILGLYEGACGEISCLDQTEYGSGNGRGLLFWRSVIGTTYKIVVAGAYGPSSGDFILAITVRCLFSVCLP